MRKVIALTGALVLAAAGACNHGSPPAHVATTGAGIVGNTDAADRLSAARCQRAHACNDIGAGKAYEDDAACAADLKHDLLAELRPSDCPYGLDEERFRVCARELESASCGDRIEKVSRLTPCRTDVLCIK